MEKKEHHNIKMYTEKELDNNLVEPAKLEAIFNECVDFLGVSQEEVQERYAFKKVRLVRWIFTYLADVQGDGVFPSPAIGHYLDRYDNEVNSLKKTARNNLPKNEYYRDIMFTIVGRLEAKGFQVRLPHNLSEKYRYFVQQKNTEFFKLSVTHNGRVYNFGGD